MFKLSVSDRLTSWKKLRQQLDDCNLDQAIYLVNEIWSQCPYIPYYLDIDKPQFWPDPWQLLTENYYCDIAKTLGIIYTLHLTKHQQDLVPELRIYYHPTTRYYYHIAYLCDGKYVLNLIEGSIVNKQHINQELQLRYRYTAADLKLEQY